MNAMQKLRTKIDATTDRLAVRAAMATQKRAEAAEARTVATAKKRAQRLAREKRIADAEAKRAAKHAEVEGAHEKAQAIIDARHAESAAVKRARFVAAMMAEESVYQFELAVYTEAAGKIAASAARDIADVDAKERAYRAANPRRLPLTRAGCIDLPRPCELRVCRHHVSSVRYVPHGHERAIPLGSPTCSLDIAADGAKTLEEVGEIIGVTRERVRQLEVDALYSLRTAARFAGMRADDISAFVHPEGQLPEDHR